MIRIEGKIVGRSDAEESFKTANDFLAHLTEKISGTG
jgi:hypothetical protein